MFGNLIAVAGGGAAGSLLRYGIILLTVRVIGAMPYYATLTVNFIGCLVMGFFAETVLVKANLPDSVKLLMTTGLLGGFTTFSSFAFDSGRMINGGAMLTAMAYVSASVIGGIALFFLGIYLAKFA
jgi:CrcB protein